MPSSLLFGINNEGRVHTLSTTGTMWRELPYVGQEFKKLSSIPHFLWAIGGDHQVYLCVHGLDVPIRVREESYQNERWIPIEGFTSRLLPTERYHYSSADGLIDRAIDQIRLPSMAWQWEGDWHLDLTLNGQPLNHDGWTYAVDFPTQYSAKKQWKSCVRRRLWVRSRRYSAINSWCAIAPLHKDATAEPFIDIAVGGHNIAGAEPGKMVVWSVTSNNRIMFRLGVSTRSPEGLKWNLVSIPLGCEVNQLSVGPTGLVWAALLDGRALVRIGVTRDCLSGESWVEVKGPGDGLRINHLSVGTCAVWAVTQDKQIWFRKGIKGEGAGMSEELAAGCGWVEMVGRMTLVSVAANDQVWAIGADDRAVYFRTGVSPADLTGKRWKALHAPSQISRASSNASLNRDRHHKSTNSLNRPHSLCETSRLGDFEEQSHSAPTAPTSLPVDSGKHFEAQLKNPKAWSPVRSVGSVVGTEVISDESIYQSDRQEACIFAEDEELGWAEYKAPWSWVEAGACTVDVLQLPNWFAEPGGIQQSELEQPWRVKILQTLKERLPNETAFDTYPKAIDTSSWVHTGEARINLNGTAYIDCILQLEWLHTTGSLTILNPDGATTMHQFTVSEITCVQCCSEPGNPRLEIHTPQMPSPSIKFQFTSDTLLEEWQTHFATVCNQLHAGIGRPVENSIWAVTYLGDAFVWDSNATITAQQNENFFQNEYDFSGKNTPFSLPLHTNCNPGLKITITGCVGDDADRIGFNLEAESTYKLRHKAHAELANIPFHFNPRFKETCVIRNSLIDDKWGNEEKEGTLPFSQGQEFKIVITVKEDDFVVFVNDEQFCKYRHRIACSSVNMLNCWGKLQIFKILLETPEPVLHLKELTWRQLGGHLRRIESCRAGVTWGIGYDHTAWVYSGGWGGGFFGSIDSHNVHPMTDSQDYRVYENQRWNPVTGYTSAGLPTDRYMWSDITGKQKRTRDQVKLLSMHWQWISDWMIDFHVPGGVDNDGWQYAVDFPAVFHAKKHFTDYVRRRRWYRRCAVATTGPWSELGHTKLLDVSLEVVNNDIDSVITVWALANDGQAMLRAGVSKSNPSGTKWEHVNSDQPLIGISCGPYKQVWAVGKNGCAYSRIGIKEDLLIGEKWHCVEPPPGAQLKQVSVSNLGIWAIDHNGKLYVRKEVTHVFPEGSHWQCIPIDPSITSASDIAPDTRSYKHVSVGCKEVWVTTDSGLLLRRIGITTSTLTGFSWDLGISGNWQYVSCRAF